MLKNVKKRYEMEIEIVEGLLGVRTKPRVTNVNFANSSELTKPNDN